MQKILTLLVLSVYCLSFSCFAADIKYKNDNYYVQLASFSKPDNAARLYNSIKEQYADKALLNETNKHSIVQLGPYKTKEEAQDAQDSLASTKSASNIINPNYKPQEKQTRLWNLRNADIKSVIAEVAKETNKNFILDQRVQGKISIISSRPITADELYQVFLSMLQISGYAAVPSGTAIKIVPNIEAKTLAGDMLSRMGRGKGDEMVVRVIPVKHVSSEQLVPVLRPLMPQWSNISAYGPSNMLIATGRADNVKRLAHIIAEVDESSADNIDIIPLRYSLAMDVVATLKNLNDNQHGTNLNRQAMIASDDKSNSILLSGPKMSRIKIRALISRLDSKSKNGALANTQVIYLHYLRAQDLVPILAGISKANFSGSVGTTIGTISRQNLDSSNPSDDNSDSGVNNQPTMNSMAAPNTQSSSNESEGDNKPKVQLIAEPNTNSLIISAPLTLMRTLKTVIKQLDVRPAQLLVEALITEIDEQDINNLGLDWGTVNTNGTGSDATQAFKEGFAVINSKTKLSNFQAELHALVSKNKANILSTPSLVVLDNHQAKILIGKNVPVQESTYPNNANGTSTASPYTTFSRQDVALHLYVRPQISHGDAIQLQIDHGNDTISETGNVASGLPIINKSSIVTSVLVNSGDTLVLGGLSHNGLQKKNNYIPILGDIPGVGQIFHNNRKTREKKVLMVFIRPIILKDKISSVQVSGSKYNAVRQEQLNIIEGGSYDRQDKNLVMKPLKKVFIPPPFMRG